MGTARAPVLGSGLWPACTCLVSKPKSRASSIAGIAGISGISKPPALSPGLVHAGEEIANHRRLPRLLEEERVVAVGSFDDVELHFLAVRLECAREGARVRGRIEPVGAEADEERRGLETFDRPLEASSSVLSREVEVGESPREVEIGVRVEPPDEFLSLMPEVALDLEVRLGHGVGEVPAPPEP